MVRSYPDQKKATYMEHHKPTLREILQAPLGDIAQQKRIAALLTKMERAGIETWTLSRLSQYKLVKGCNSCVWCLTPKQYTLTLPRHLSSMQDRKVLHGLGEKGINLLQFILDKNEYPQLEVWVFRYGKPVRKS